MFFSQVPRTTISFTWRIKRSTSLLISIINLVFLIFKWCRCFISIYFSTSVILFYFALLLGLSGSWILSIPVIELSEVFFLLFLRGICCLSGVTLDTLYPCTYIPERLGLSFLISIYLGFSILVLFWYKLADEIDLDLFTAFNMSYVSVLWVDLDLSNDLPLSGLLMVYLYFFLLDACGFYVLMTVSILFFAMVGVMDSFTTVNFFPMSLIPSLEILSVVVTNKFLEDMILVIDILYLVY